MCNLRCMSVKRCYLKDMIEVLPLLRAIKTAADRRCSFRDLGQSWALPTWLTSSQSLLLLWKHWIFHDKRIPLDKPQKMTNNHPMRQSFFFFFFSENIGTAAAGPAGPVPAPLPPPLLSLSLSLSRSLEFFLSVSLPSPVPIPVGCNWTHILSSAPFLQLSSRSQFPNWESSSHSLVLSVPTPYQSSSPRQSTWWWFGTPNCIGRKWRM